MELRIKNYKMEEAAVLFECNYGGNDFQVTARPEEGLCRQGDYSASDRVKERIGTILLDKAEKLTQRQMQ